MRLKKATFIVMGVFILFLFGESLTQTAAPQQKAQPSKFLLLGKKLYEEGSFREAIENFFLALNQASGTDELTSIYTYLAACYYNLGEETSSNSATFLKKLVEANPNATLDPRLFPRGFIVLFEKTRNEIAGQKTQKPAAIGGTSVQDSKKAAAKFPWLVVGGAAVVVTVIAVLLLKKGSGQGSSSTTTISGSTTIPSTTTTIPATGQFFEGFENYADGSSPSDWSITGNARIVSNVTYQGNRALYVWGSSGATKSLDSMGFTTGSFDITIYERAYNWTDSAGSALIQLTLFGKYVAFGPEKSGNAYLITCYDNGVPKSFSVPSGVNVENWVKYRMVLNTVSGYVEFFVNDSRIATGYGQSKSESNRIMLGAGSAWNLGPGNGSAVFDSVSIQQ